MNPNETPETTAVWHQTLDWCNKRDEMQDPQHVALANLSEKLERERNEWKAALLSIHPTGRGTPDEMAADILDGIQAMKNAITANMEAPNVKEHAPTLAGASVETGGEAMKLRKDSADKGAGSGCMARLVRSRFVSVDEVKERWSIYATEFGVPEWDEAEMAEMGWLAMVGIAVLIENCDQHGCDNGNNRNDDRNPRTNRVGSASSPLKLVLPNKSLPKSPVVVPSGNPLADFFVGLLAKFIGVFGFVGHISSANVQGHAPLTDGECGKHDKEVQS